MKKVLHFLMCACTLFIAVTQMTAQSPARISIQGTLKNSNGASVADGTYAVKFLLYDVQTGGTALWQEDATVDVIGGIYSHYLGSVVPLNGADFSSTLFLGVRIGNFELTPRTELTYAPYTFASATVVCSGAVGDVKYSILNPDKFAEVNGDCWVPLDGRPLAQGDILSQLTGLSNLPNAGGLFVRAQDFANSDNDPGRTSSSVIATLQTDDVKPHNHTMNSAGSHSHFYIQEGFGGNGNLAGGSTHTGVSLSSGEISSSTSTAGDHTHQINNNSGTETRPKNINLWIYIRIN